MCNSDSILACALNGSALAFPVLVSQDQGLQVMSALRLVCVCMCHSVSLQLKQREQYDPDALDLLAIHFTLVKVSGTCIQAPLSWLA